MGVQLGCPPSLSNDGTLVVQTSALGDTSPPVASCATCNGSSPPAPPPNTPFEWIGIPVIRVGNMVLLQIDSTTRHPYYPQCWVPAGCLFSEL